jgi:uncharacterized protein
MSDFLLFYDYAADYLERRGEFRAAHLSLAWESNENGHLVLAGALANPPDGAVFHFRVPSRSIIEEFVRVDPYVTSGIVTRWWIREWTTVVGDEAATPVFPPVEGQK